MDATIVNATLILALWIVAYGTLFMMSPRLANWFARWSLWVVRRVAALPIALLGNLLRAVANAIRGGNGGRRRRR